MDSEFDMDIDWYDIGETKGADHSNSSVETDYDNYCFIEDDDEQLFGTFGNALTMSIKPIISRHDYDGYIDFYITDKSISIVKKYNTCIHYSMIICTIISTLFIYFQLWLLHQ